MLSLRRGRVTAVVERQAGLARVEVDGAPCIAYPALTGPVALGDDVVVNVQARSLGLGSGGFDILYANLTRGLELPVAEAAHVMKLPYTPVQHAALHGEESSELPKDLDGMPVVACSLHSQVAPVCAALTGLRVAYVQIPGGALPVALSDALRALQRRRLVSTTIAAGACFGGELEAVNVYSGLLLARAEDADVAVCAIGPGIVGTATPLGHGGTAAADSLVAALRLGGRAVLTLRMSEGDLRRRHRALSHHSEAVLALVGEGCRVAWPNGCPFERPSSGELIELDVDEWRDACAGLPLEHMSRGPAADPWFFAAAYAAGRLARELLGS
jgi:Protein of unknown function (DUF3866)